MDQDLKELLKVMPELPLLAERAIAAREMLTPEQAESLKSEILTAVDSFERLKKIIEMPGLGFVDMMTLERMFTGDYNPKSLHH